MLFDACPCGFDGLEVVVVRVGQYPSIGTLSCVVGFEVFSNDPFPTLVGVEPTEKFASLDPNVAIEGRYGVPCFLALGIAGDGVSPVVYCASNNWVKIMDECPDIVPSTSFKCFGNFLAGLLNTFLAGFDN